MNCFQISIFAVHEQLRKESNMTDKNTDYSNLKEKTIFDFCKDAEMRKVIIGGDYSESYYKECSEIVIMKHLMEYAIRTNNKELYEAAEKAHAIAEKDFERMADEAAKKGLLIDC